jgi:long-chain fatty acid transport protein|nr:outer membrane protein transport protein [Kofleriaceae bacterium]
MRTLLASILLTAAATSAAHANAFYLSEHDARETGRGDTGVATDTDPSAIFFNPAGIAVGDGTRVSIGGSLIIPDASFTPTGGTKYDSTTGAQVLPSLFVTHQINSMFAVGVGFHAPFGLEIDWPVNSPSADVIQTQSLRTYYLSAVAGINLDQFIPGLSAGVGIDIVPSTVELQQAIYFGADHTCTNDTTTAVNCGSAHLDGTATGVGYRAGVMYKPRFAPRLSLGLMYNSQVKLDYTGSADFDAPAPYRSQLPPDGDVSTSITIPERIVGGVAYRPVDRLEVELNISWVDWSKFQELAIKLPNGTSAVTPEDYTNTTSIRFGAEYRLPLGAAVRVGYIHDPTPVPGQTLTAQLPDADRNDLTAGASYKIGNYEASVGLLYVLPTTRNTPPATGSTTFQPEYHGEYDISAFVAAVQLQGKFGGTGANPQPQ